MCAACTRAAAAIAVTPCAIQTRGAFARRGYAQFVAGTFIVAGAIDRLDAFGAIPIRLFRIGAGRTCLCKVRITNLARCFGRVWLKACLTRLARTAPVFAGYNTLARRTALGTVRTNANVLIVAQINIFPPHRAFDATFAIPIGIDRAIALTVDTGPPVFTRRTVQTLVNFSLAPIAQSMHGRRRRRHSLHTRGRIAA